LSIIDQVTIGSALSCRSFCKGFGHTSSMYGYTKMGS
jgi:hypothetical protein